MRGLNWLHQRVSEAGPIVEPISHCQHRWTPMGSDKVRCEGPCGVVVLGRLAAEPPAEGMDWSRATLVTPNGLNLAKNPLRGYRAGAIHGEHAAEQEAER